jgi:hypothetical protein
MPEVPNVEPATNGLTKDDYAFTVTDVYGRKWDVYHYKTDGEHIGTGDCKGTLVFRYDENLQQWIIGAMCAFWLDENEVLLQLRVG